MKGSFYIFIITLFFATTLHAQTREIENLKNKRKKLQTEINKTTAELKKTKNDVTQNIKRINLLDKQIDSRKKIINILASEMDLLDKKRDSLKISIAQLKINLNDSKNEYKKAVLGVFEKKKKENALLFVFSGKNFGQIIRRIEYLRTYSSLQKKQQVDIRNQQGVLDREVEALKSTLINKQNLISIKDKEAKNLSLEEENRKKEIQESKQKQKKLQVVIAQKKKQSQQLNRKIRNLIEEEIRRQERIRREREARRKKMRANSSERRAISNEILENDANVKMLSKNIEGNKGRLMLPVTGRARIVSGFGRSQNQKWKHIVTNNNGIEISSVPDAKIRSVFKGVVSKIVSFPGYNNCIIIRHGNYYTFYGNIKRVYVKIGQKVNTGQLLGEIYTDNDTKESVMHFQIWKNTTKLNPAQWLRM